MNDEGVKVIISIQCKNDKEKMRMGEYIHSQLRGNRDYFESNIILNIDRPDTVDLYIFDECEEIPVIDFNRDLENANIKVDLADEIKE